MSDAAASGRGAAALRDAVGARRRAMARLAAPRGRTERWWHAGIAVLSLAVTLAAAWTARELVEERGAAHFERESMRTVRALQNRMAHYEDALQAGVAALDVAGGRVDQNTWRRFADGLELTRRYPGVNGIGLVERVPTEALDALERRERVGGQPGFDVHPAVDAAVHFPIIFIEPRAGNRAALGLDLAHEPQRHRAALDALRSGEARITGPISLVQESADKPAFLFFAPYSGAERFPTRADAFDGLVYAPFVVEELVSGALPAAERDIDLRLVDGDTVLHDEFGDADANAATRSVEISLYGRTWRVDMRPAYRLGPAETHLQPVLVLLAGLLIDAMLLGLFVSIMRARRALERSAEIGAQLAERSRELERSNRGLERFACVVSHDLKAPLRGIGDLAWYLEEDLEPLIAAGRAPAEVPRHLERIGAQTRRMEALIDGILDYSGVGEAEPEDEPVDTGVLLAELAELHERVPGQLVVEGPAPVLNTSLTRLTQVLGNLVGNAFKYHDAPQGACVRVSFEPRADAWRVRVADDGPGIDPKHHERVFEMFQTLGTKDAADATGVGLAIVRRIVDDVGGRIHIEPTPGRGTTFVLDWPARGTAVGRVDPLQTPRAMAATRVIPPEPRKAA